MICPTNTSDLEKNKYIPVVDYQTRLWNWVLGIRPKTKNQRLIRESDYNNRFKW